MTLVCVLSGKTKITEPFLPVFSQVLLLIFCVFLTRFHVFASAEISTLPVILTRDILLSAYDILIVIVINITIKIKNNLFMYLYI